jgi:hemolysin III
MAKYQATVYPPKEEKFNIISHAIGLVLSVIALVILLIKTGNTKNEYATISAAVYGSSLIILYAASTLYHSSKKLIVRNRLNILDHAAIFVLIAGTYTPFTLVTLPSPIGTNIFMLVWAIALAGVILKLFFIGRYKKISMLIYVGMGWIIVLAIKPLIQSLPLPGLIWLVLGGVSYSIGAFFYSREQLNNNHAIFHVFVLLGSFCHFVSVYWYVL